MTEQEQFAAALGEIKGEIKSEGKHTRQSISKLFDLANANEHRITKIESGDCPSKGKIEEKVESISNKLDNHSHDGHTVVRSKDSIDMMKLGKISGAIVIGLGVAVAALIKILG